MNAYPCGLFRTASSPVPASRRAKVNAGILRLIRGGANPDAEQVFNAYTGKGGLHELDHGEFENRHAFTKAKQDFENGQFFTPDWVCALAREVLDPASVSRICDPACGHGAFFNQFADFELHGADVDSDVATVASHLFPKARVQVSDIRCYSLERPVDFIVGNPPFGIRMSAPAGCPLKNSAGEARSEDVFLWFTARFLRLGGSAAIVAPAHWLEDELLDAPARRFVAAHFVREADFHLPPDTFRSYGLTHLPTKLVLLRTLLPGEKNQSTPVVVKGASFESLSEAWRLQNSNYLAFRERSRHLKACLTLEQARDTALRADRKVAYGFRKYVYQLRLLNPCMAESQWQQWAEAHKPPPEGINYETWEATRVKPENVLAETRRQVRAQHERESHLVRMSRGRRGIILTSGSAVAGSALRGQAKTWGFHELAAGTEIDLAVLQDNLARLNKRRGTPRITFQQINWRKIARSWIRRHAEWLTPVELAARPEDLALVERAYQDLGARGTKQVRREPLQVTAVASVIRKPGSILSWEMGSGKTLGALAWEACQRELLAGQAGATLIVASSLACEMNWKPALAELGLPYGGRKNLNRPLPAFLLLSHHEATVSRWQLKRLARRGAITQLIADESDEFGNRDAQRTRSLLHFGRCVRRRLLTTGTLARNSAAELFCQLDLVFAGSPFFRCIGPVAWEWDTETKEFFETSNPHFGNWYPPFRGLPAFRETHAPRKPTVLGEHRNIPAVVNPAELRHFLGCVRSRLRLADLIGRNPVRVSTKALELSPAEMSLYELIVENARCMVMREFDLAKQESRKASQLALAHAIRLLQQACSIPDKFPEFPGGPTAKARYIAHRCGVGEASHMAVGTIWKEAASTLAQHLRQDNSREVFVFDGEASFAARRRVIAAFTASARAVLVTTQQAIRSSVNIPVVSEVIAEALPWNFASLEQWARRFVRYNSQWSQVQVELLICKKTIEERILGLLLRKDVVSYTTSGDDLFENEDELFEKYGINHGDLDMLVDYLLGKADRSLSDRDEAA